MCRHGDYCRFVALLLALAVNACSFESEPLITFKQEVEIATEVDTRDPLPGRTRSAIIFIADGMGFGHLSLAMAMDNQDGGDTWHRFTATGWQTTHSTAGFLTDSAASATAIATGVDTYPGRMGVDFDGNAVLNLVERAQQAGYRTGVVTDSYIWDATPAAFVIHHPRRGNDEAADILQKLAESGLDVLVGELEDVGEEAVPSWDRSVEVLEQRFTMVDGLSRVPDAAGPVMALFEEDQVTDLSSQPNLPQLTQAALERLSSGGDPFLLLVESEEMDSASHANNAQRAVAGIKAITATLGPLLDFVDANPDTLLLFTSDHETGGMSLGADETNGLIDVGWSTSEHTGAVVPVLAVGAGADRFRGMHTNQGLGQILHSLTGDAAEAASSP